MTAADRRRALTAAARIEHQACEPIILADAAARGQRKLLEARLDS